MTDQLYVLPILLFSVIIHEISHGLMALRLGDTTARDMGRLTLNPIPHLDLMGSIIVPLFSLLMTGRVFIAWAKPVPVNPYNFSNYRRDDILVSVVGPVSNIFLALVCSIATVILVRLEPITAGFESQTVDQAMHFLLQMFYGGVFLNIVLAVFNMIPIPPLDGSHVAASLMPDEMSHQYRSIGFFGIFVILFLMRWQPFAMFFDSIINAFAFPFELFIRALT